MQFRHDFSEKAICPLPDTEETDGAGKEWEAASDNWLDNVFEVLDVRTTIEQLVGEWTYA